MAPLKSFILVATFTLVVVISTQMAFGDKHGGNGNGNKNGNSGNNNNNNNNSNNNGNGNNGDNNNGGNNDGNGNNGDNNNGGNSGAYDPETDYDDLEDRGDGRNQAYCRAKGDCYHKILTCPAQCREKKPKDNKKHKGCFINCRKCEAICKYRKANCNGYGSLCYDPRFVGGDGVMFYFHGSKGRNFAVVSDHNLQINAHFIGTRPQGRTRDFTWVQALAVMFDSHNLVIAAKKVTKWDDNVDALLVKYDGEGINIPFEGEAEWRTNTELRVVVIERTNDTNSVRVTVSGLVELDINVRPIGEEENRVHNYRLPKNDAFAHLETQFKFKGLSDSVEGILGKTYQPDYVSPVKVGVPMPLMGGEDKYRTPSLLSPSCKYCIFKWQSGLASSV